MYHTFYLNPALIDSIMIGYRSQYKVALKINNNLQHSQMSDSEQNRSESAKQSSRKSRSEQYQDKPQKYRNEDYAQRQKEREAERDREKDKSGEYKNEEQDSGQQGFYGSDQQIQNPRRKKLKHKHIKKRKAKGITTKKQNQERKKKQYSQAAHQAVREIFSKMRKFFDQDQKLIKANKKANKRLIYVRELSQKLTNIFVCEQFLQSGGLEYFQEWLKNEKDPVTTMKVKVFQILENINASEEYFDRAQELKKMIQKGKKIPFFKQICQRIMNKWGEGVM